MVLFRIPNRGSWFFANAFDLYSQPLPFHCLPKHILARTLISIPFGSRPGRSLALEDLQIQIPWMS